MSATLTADDLTQGIETTSVTPLASVADVGWFVASPDVSSAAATLTAAAGSVGTADPDFDETPPSDAVLAQENFDPQDTDPLLSIQASSDADEYADAVDALLADEIGVLVESA